MSVELKNGLYVAFFGYISHKTKQITDEKPKGNSTPLLRVVSHREGQFFNGVSREETEGEFALLQDNDGNCIRPSQLGKVFGHLVTFQIKGYSCEELPNGQLKWTAHEPV
jgi:hypothetical protein